MKTMYLQIAEVFCKSIHRYKYNICHERKLPKRGRRRRQDIITSKLNPRRTVEPWLDERGPSLVLLSNPGFVPEMHLGAVEAERC